MLFIRRLLGVDFSIKHSFVCFEIYNSLKNKIDSILREQVPLLSSLTDIYYSQKRILDFPIFPPPRSHSASQEYVLIDLVTLELLRSLTEYKVKVTLSCLTLCDPRYCIVHGILQVRILEWVPFPFSRVSSQPKDQTQVSRIACGFLTS